MTAAAAKKAPLKPPKKKLKGTQLPLPTVFTFSAAPVRRLVMEQFVRYQAQNVPVENWITFTEEETVVKITAPSTASMENAMEKIKHFNGIIVVNKCRCGKPASFKDEELGEHFCSESCRKGALWGKSVNAPMQPGMVVRIDKLAPGQRFQLVPASFPKGHPFNPKGGVLSGPVTGHLVYATAGRARVELDKLPETKTFINSRTGNAVELTSASVKQMDWAPEVEVEVLAGMKEFPLLSPKSKVQKSQSRETAETENNDMAGRKAAKKAAKANGAGRKAVNLETQEVKLVKFPGEEDKVRGNQLAVLTVLKDHGKKMTAADLVKKLKTGTKNKLGELAVWTFNRPILVDKGFITVS